MFKGSFCAVITPFKGGAFDEDAFRALAERQVAGGSNGLVPCGTTGEVPTLSHAEYLRVIRATVQQVSGRAAVVAGVSTNSTAHAVELVETVTSLKPDAVMVTVPYYNRPSQEGLYQHFKAVSKASKLPILVYNIPGRTGVNLLPATLARLAKDCRNITAVKEASGNLDQVSDILGRVPASFSVLSGDDPLTLPMMAIGAKGVVSVLANVLPIETARLCALAAAGKRAEAAKLHLRLLPLTKALFIESNPVPAKAALAMLDLCGEEVRLPLVGMGAANRAVLRSELKKAGLL